MKTLLLFEESSTFATYLKDQIPKDLVDVYEPYKKVNTIFGYILRSIAKRCSISFFQTLWLGDWKNKIQDYNSIIVFDNCLRPSLLSWFKKNIKEKNKVKIWLWNVPDKKNEKHIRDFSIYCFDESFSYKNGFTFVEQFYFGSVHKTMKKEFDSDFYFIGADKGRLEELENLYKELNQRGFKCNFYVVSNSNMESKDGFIVTNKQISYEDIIKNIEKTKVIVDITKKGQNGLTLRALESLFYERKLITNNKNIKKYDFYNPNNIFILGEDDYHERLVEFVNTKYVEIDSRIKENYTFNRWLESINKGI